MSTIFFKLCLWLALKQWDNLIIEQRVSTLFLSVACLMSKKHPQGYDFAYSKKWLSENRSECNGVAVHTINQERPVCKHFGAVTFSPHLL